MCHRLAYAAQIERQVTQQNDRSINTYHGSGSPNLSRQASAGQQCANSAHLELVPVLCVLRPDEHALHHGAQVRRQQLGGHAHDGHLEKAQHGLDHFARLFVQQRAHRRQQPRHDELQLGPELEGDAREGHDGGGHHARCRGGEPRKHHCKEALQAAVAQVRRRVICTRVRS